MPGLIDNGAVEGLCYTTGSGLQWESKIGGSTLLLNPGEDLTGVILLESSGKILLEDGTSFILLE